MSSDPDPTLPGERSAADGGAALVPAFTLVVWVACVTVGLTGLLERPGGRPAASPAAASQPVVQVVTVSLEDVPTPALPAAPEATAAPVSDPLPSVPAMPSIPTVALPSDAIAFAVPAAGPARVGPAADAVPAGRSSGPAVQRIAFGVGVGRQPKPDYPDDAKDAGQQGVVTIRMSVDADGRVKRAWVAKASPFPSLNRSAVDVVRDAWRFPAGPPRLYEVPITFHLNQQ